ncbi:MAG: hypothetical protein HY321_21360 [Armatimonadetes bacterium]|nr:hypothetical protein [Armatimonadota bacterium]
MEDLMRGRASQVLGAPESWPFWLVFGLVYGFTMLVVWPLAAGGRVDMTAGRVAMALVGSPLGSLAGGYCLGGRCFAHSFHLRVVVAWLFGWGIGPGLVVGVTLLVKRIF